MGARDPAVHLRAARAAVAVDLGGAGANAGSSGGAGGGGTGLGGAIFIRAGSLTLADSSFTDNATSGGEGRQTNGQGKGSAIFDHLVPRPWMRSTQPSAVTARLNAAGGDTAPTIPMAAAFRGATPRAPERDHRPPGQ